LMNNPAVKRKAGFYIEVGCPGCGGELELQQDFFVISCQHCGSILRIRMPDTPPVYIVRKKISRREIRFNIDRFLKENKQPLTASDIQYKQIYYPYWHINAIVLKTRNKVEYIEDRTDEGYGYSSYTRAEKTSIPIKEKKTEVTLSPFATSLQAGIMMENIPSSLGLRTEYILAVPFSEENIDDDIHAMPVIIPWEEAYKRLEKSVQTVGQIEVADFGQNKNVLFKPMASLIYFPYFIVESHIGHKYGRWIIDGVTGRVIKNVEQINGNPQNEESEPIKMEFGKLDIDHHRCPNCGEDLSAEQSYIYICSNCQQLISMERASLFNNELEITSNSGTDKDVLIPFWSLKFENSISRSLGSAFGSNENLEHLIIPAMRMSNLESAYKLSRRMTVAFPELDLISLIDCDERFKPVQISPSEAIVLAQVIYARERMGISSTLAMHDITSLVKETKLFYMPFHAEQYFMLDSISNSITFVKAVL